MPLTAKIVKIKARTESLPLPPGTEVRAIPELVLSLPWVHTPTYGARAVDMMLTPRQAVALRALRDGLNSVDARLEGGRIIRNGYDALRVVLNRVADKLSLGPNGEIPPGNEDRT